MGNAASIKIGLAGLGTVGSGAARLLYERRIEIERELGAGLEISHVLDRHAKKKWNNFPWAKTAQIVSSPGALARNSSIVVELLGGVSTAKTLALCALQSNKPVVTANKWLLCEYWKEILSAARLGRTKIYFEASVASGVPVLQALRQLIPTNRVTGLTAILNSTSNFILTEIENRGAGMAQALARAQSLGIAEVNPVMDVSGQDTRHKLSVLGSLITGAWVAPQQILCEGIERITADDMRYAKDYLHKTIRLLGRLDMISQAPAWALAASVCPALVDLGSPFAAVQGTFNAIALNTHAAGELFFSGPGAGAMPAASAIVSDIVLAAKERLRGRDLGYPAEALPKKGMMDNGAIKIIPAPSLRFCYMLRFMAEDRPGVLSRLSGILAKAGISLAQVHQPMPSVSPVPIFMVTHAAQEAQWRQALSHLKKMKSLARLGCVLRFEV